MVVGGWWWWLVVVATAAAAGAALMVMVVVGGGDGEGPVPGIEMRTPRMRPFHTVAVKNENQDMYHNKLLRVCQRESTGNCDSGD